MAAADAPQAFALCAELAGHREDVRCCVAAGSLGVATASRDRTLRLWPYAKPTSEADAAAAAGARFGEPTVFVGHGHYVTALAWAPPGAVAGAAAPQGALVSGSRDQAVFVWDVATATPLMRLTGHAQQVAAVAVCSGGSIVSGDLGGEIRVWRAGACVQTLPGPSPVLTLAALPDGGFVAGTGGPEFAIKRFAADAGGLFAAVPPALRGHADSVRRVAAAPEALAAAGGALLSASHDGSARLWSASGECLAEYLGHTALVYAVAASAGGEHLVATGSEDDTARVWPAGGGAPVASLPHPGCVWDVAWLPGGQLVTACADGRARVWTPRADHADAALAAAHAASLLARAAAAAAPAPGAPRSDAALSALLPPGVKLEPPSVLSRPGAKDGATKVVREANGAAMAYSWDAAAGRWEQIGEVVGADGSGAGAGGGTSGGNLGVGGRVLDGVSYDFVFDVDVADGAPARKLPYNAGDNPYDVADKWLEREGLPPSYREQIVAFIIQNTGGAASASMGAMPQNFDPFTGGGSYTPSAGAPPAAAPRRALAFCPVRTAVLFESAPAGLDACGRKLREFAASAPATAALSGGDDAALSALLAACAPGAPAAAGIDAAAVAALFGKLLTWQEAHLFAVLDLARAAMLRPDAAEALLGVSGGPGGGAGGDALVAALLRAAAGAAAGGAAVVTGLRCVANASATQAGRAWAQRARQPLLEAFAAAPGCPAKAARAAYATALLNAAVEAATPDARSAVISAAVAAAAATPAEDDDAAFRALAALGTAAGADAAAKAAACELGGADVAAAAAQRRGAPGAKAPAAAQDVLDILGAAA